jgi:XTP/dITP diphosphohydrolase
MENHKRKAQLEAFSRLLDIMDELREKCPWDRKQTNESLRHLTIEETYELADAILNDDPAELRKELGDVLLHIVFYAKIASEKKQFDIADVIHSLCEKLINRHPHIYGDVKVENEEQVKQNWEQIKLREGSKSVLSGVSRGIPSVIKALRMQEKAAQVGFDWPTADDVWAKVDEELAELKHEMQHDPGTPQSAGEFGDFLFSLINLARKYNINPDDALELTNQKFLTRFTYIEDQARQSGKGVAELSLDEMERHWQNAKVATGK